MMAMMASVKEKTMKMVLLLTDQLAVVVVRKDFLLRFPFVRLESAQAHPIDQTRGLYP